MTTNNIEDLPQYEMHSGPSQPDDAGYMDGDYWW